jgi:hypothetical protein
MSKSVMARLDSVGDRCDLRGDLENRDRLDPRYDLWVMTVQ